MRVLFRADASVVIGTGHVSRCGALAEALYERGIRATLLTRPLPGSVVHPAASLDVIEVERAGFAENETAEIARDWLEASIDESWLIVDHYGLDRSWEDSARGRRSRVLVIDDHVDRQHSCDILLNQNILGEAESAYADQVPPTCLLLLGPTYALLRPEFARARSSATPRVGRVKRVLVFFGGTDEADLTSRTVEAVRLLSPQRIRFDVVVGLGNPRVDAVRAAAARVPSIAFHCQTEQMATLMCAADVSIGAGGTTTWERCCVGLPSLVVIAAENQRNVIVGASAAGACKNLGDADHLTANDIASGLDDALSGRIDLATMSRAAMQVTDGRGAGRVADALVGAK